MRKRERSSTSAFPRLWLTVISALMALALLPAAQAVAAPGTLTVNVTGTGSGELVSGFFVFPAGTPSMACSYASPGPATGTCSNELTEYEPGHADEYLLEKPAPGSVFAGWTIEEGTDASGTCFNEESQIEFEEFFGGQVCGLEGEGGNGNAKVTATFAGIPFQLTLFVNGQGTVTSTPAGINCSGGEECSEELEGAVTLTAAPAAGYVVAGWIGCRQAAGDPTTCTLVPDRKSVV